MTETKTKPTPKVVYAVEGNEITRLDTQVVDAEKEVVAKYDPKAGIIELIRGKEQFKVAIIRHLNDKGHKFTEVGEIGMQFKRTDIPPKPKMSMIQGDKTPQLVEWYAKYHPKAFLAKFQVRQMEVRVGFEDEDYIFRDPNTGKEETRTRQKPIYERVDGFDYSIPALKTGEQRLLGDCKTHLTQKIEPVSDYSDYDTSLDDEINEREGRI